MHGNLIHVDHLTVSPETPAVSTCRAGKDTCASGMRFNLSEAAGGLGDLGIFIPLLVGMVKRCGLQLGPALFLAGAMNVITGFLFQIPMPVQPMKAIAVVAISEGFNEAQILAAGIICGAVLLMLGITGSMDWLSRRIPASVVRGLQLGLGLKLAYEGIGMVTKTHALAGWDSIGVGLLCAAVAFWLHRSKRLPAALVIFVIGLISLFAAHTDLIAQLHLGISWHLPALGNLADWRRGLLEASLPQIPLTLLNSVIAVCALSTDLFPHLPAQPKRVAISVALMNLVCCPLGGMPMCHGAGGLAGQYRFGARTGGSIVMLGGAKMLLALAFGGSLWFWMQNYPQSVLGILLACSGLELALVCRDQRTLRSLMIVTVTTVASLAISLTVGFAAGWLLAIVLLWVDRFSRRRREEA
jgi:predicted benzoate:H+ symporter BenE